MQLDAILKRYRKRKAAECKAEKHGRRIRFVAARKAERAKQKKFNAQNRPVFA